MCIICSKRHANVERWKPMLKKDQCTTCDVVIGFDFKQRNRSPCVSITLLGWWHDFPCFQTALYNYFSKICCLAWIYRRLQAKSIGESADYFGSYDAMLKISLQHSSDVSLTMLSYRPLVRPSGSTSYQDIYLAPTLFFSDINNLFSN